MVVVVAIVSTEPTRECVRLWNAPDNASVRAAVAADVSRRAAMTAYSIDGPGRVCYVTIQDGAGRPDDTYVIWPDNLFDNGALHDYQGPFALKQGYLGHPLNRESSLSISATGRIER